MAVLMKARTQDFEKVYPLLKELNNSRLTKDDWKQLFVKRWGSQEDYLGYMLMDSTEVVGFLGLIFCSRLINNTMHQFCNLTSAIVKKRYRSESLLLFLPLLKLKEYTLTDFTPSKEVYVILKKLGFKDLETKTKIVLPLSVPDFLGDKSFVEFNKDSIKGFLNERDLKIYYDHIEFQSIHLLIKSEDGNCYVVASRTRKKFLYFAQVHYLNNITVFLKYINKVSAKICLRLNVSGLIIDERYIEDSRVKCAIAIRRRQPTLFKSKALEKKDIDTLYSELHVLNL